ncbi:MAG: nuclear transport factor 2 family protein [Bdellovibrionales bacterium]|nr:nuclear transport factor 2 family protein [Bdellovibrionales bacterium]
MSLNRKPLDTVNAQVEAYNNRDLELFLSFYAENIKITMEDQESPQVTNLEQLANQFDSLFRNSPELHAEIISERVEGESIIHQEQITGRAGFEGKSITVNAEYKLENGLIKSVYFYNLKVNKN